mmetsp:Transcript_20784/g.59291  ORF Transcript_20784/g.59291 Transcript_20784/m.59291 type:complete len:314 (+) Transcript_20784:268-1209(+)
MEWIDMMFREIKVPTDRLKATMTIAKICDGVFAALEELLYLQLVHGDPHLGNIGLRVTGDGMYEAVLVDLDRLRKDPSTPEGRLDRQEVNASDGGPRVVDSGRDMWLPTKALLRFAKIFRAHDRLVEMLSDVHKSAAAGEMPGRIAMASRAELMRLPADLADDDGEDDPFWPNAVPFSPGDTDLPRWASTPLFLDDETPAREEPRGPPILPAFVVVGTGGSSGSPHSDHHTLSTAAAPTHQPKPLLLSSCSTSVPPTPGDIQRSPVVMRAPAPPPARPAPRCEQVLGFHVGTMTLVRTVHQQPPIPVIVWRRD